MIENTNIIIKHIATQNIIEKRVVKIKYIRSRRQV